ncbi:hypothetical protein SSP24_10530 [Streptomyces spinoverrucosus]|uniref:Uncharacterized protein n=1 Tax=Streptomyces spinoverrucosus TaxID=284043 RepID=A0A4Y3VBC5_9ACTN|nr:DUF6343 family protein [Streptomyces spinoverrucosus]GEC03398.1 hypothetical protein SSP24_10530 [Streptomyces spinoverrucosus]GHB35978.1 hypothetical protein GCM10010397_02040 [Streptomyces spinoverrucosus]
MGRGQPVSRARSGMIGRRFPRTGTEPSTARSALRLRMLLTAVFLPVFVAATVLFAVWAANSAPGDAPGPAPLTGLAVACGALALVAAVDGWVVRRRMRRERGGRRA